MTCQRIALTPGEPAGIGPDLCLAILAESRPFELLLVADRALLFERARQLGVDFDVEPFDPDQAPRAGACQLLQVDGGAPARPGRPDTGTAPYVLETLERAAGACREGQADALVTGPVHKGIINDAGIPFTGHTELLASLCGTDAVLMLMVANALRVALVTTHLPLRDVPGAITRQRVQRALELLVDGLRTHFGLSRPRVLVCGLNPHAGESGHLGEEERTVIAPAIAASRLEADITGPWPADSVFTPRRLAGADAVLAMYHDQGLTVVKHAAMGRAVNVTLGLPFVRTSVDHGTALDLAGTGRADPGSLRTALGLAHDLLRGTAP